MFRPFYLLYRYLDIFEKKNRVAEWSALPTGHRGDSGSIPTEVETFFAAINSPETFLVVLNLILILN